MHQPLLVQALLAIMVVCVMVVMGLLVWWKRWHTSQLARTEQMLKDQHGIHIQEYAIFPGLCPCEIDERQEGWRQQYLALKSRTGTSLEGQEFLRWTQVLADHWGAEPYISIDPEEIEKGADQPE